MASYVTQLNYELNIVSNLRLCQDTLTNTVLTGAEKDGCEGQSAIDNTDMEKTGKEN